MFRGRRRFTRGRGRSSGGSRRGRLPKGMPRNRRAPRPSRTVRGGGSSSINTSAIRRLFFFPKRFAASTSGLNQDSSWWLETLQIAGRIIMLILSHLLTVTEDDENQAKSIPTGCLMKVALGAEDLVYDTPFVSDNGTESTARFTMARVDSIKVTVIPAAHLTSRAGTLYLNIEPVNQGVVLGDWSVRGTETTSLVELQQQPRVLIASAVSPLSVTWAPKVEDFGYEWQQFGSQTKTGTYSFGVGGLPIVYLTVGYSDLSSNTSDLTEQYALTEAMFDVVIKSQVQLRYGEQQVYTRRDPISMHDYKKLIVLNGKSAQLISDPVCDGRFLTWTVPESGTSETGSPFSNMDDH